ncbi:tripartite motif-containing protein 2-like [Branchiostoma lanceolatum]|uniref:tripartite motif-containing protein 2-like n=1 Tax=Branchiostoma lanceolatum TaxID=7740 RepID=UPI0034520DD7
MASNFAINEITEEFLVCQVCLEDFKQPKMLPCLHTFCQLCLEKLLAAEPEGKLACPTCRQDVPLPQNGVQGLKSNFLVDKLHGILQQQPKGEGETPEPRETGVPCTVCDKGSTAEFYCVECTDHMCQTCNDVHRGLKLTRSHKVVTIQDLQSGQFSAELQASGTSRCKDHSERNKFYCDTCQRVICLHCVVTAHRDHQYVEIEKAAERERAKLRGKLSTVQNTADLHEKWIQQLQSVREEWPSQVQRTEEQIAKQTQAIIEAAEKMKNDRISQLRAMNAARETQLETAMEAAEMDLASARSRIQHMDDVLESGTPAEVLSVAGELTDWEPQNAAEKPEMTKNFVNLIVDPPACNVKVEQKVAKLMGGIRQTRVPILLKTVGKKVTGAGDGEFSRPTSLAVTPEGNIVVTDYGNKRLQFLDKDGSSKKIDLGFPPLCVAVQTNGELLVTGDGHSIHVLDRQGRRGSRVIQVPGATDTQATTRGIAVDKFGRIIVTVGSQSFVISPAGDVIRKFEGKGQSLHGPALLVTVNSSNQIIVSDMRNNNLKIFDPAGRYLFTIGSFGWGPGQLNYPAGVITDREDNIMVADSVNHRVSLFSEDGVFIRHVLTQEKHGLNFPVALTMHDGHLVVADRHSIKFFLI